MVLNARYHNKGALTSGIDKAIAHAAVLGLGIAVLVRLDKVFVVIAVGFELGFDKGSVEAHANWYLDGMRQLKLAQDVRDIEGTATHAIVQFLSVGVAAHRRHPGQA